MSNNLNQGASEADFLPCPHCGGESVSDFIEDVSYIVECNDCGCRTSMCGSAEQATSVWNRRTPAATTGAAPSVKTWQERVQEFYASTFDPALPPREQYMQDEIADLRAQLAAKGQGEPVAEWVNYEHGFQYLVEPPLPDGTKLYLAAPASAQPADPLEARRKMFAAFGEYITKDMLPQEIADKLLAAAGAQPDQRDSAAEDEGKK